MEEILHQLIDRWFIPSSMGFQPSKVVQNFFISSIHRIYLPKVVLGELPMPSAENVHWPTRLPGGMPGGRAGKPGGIPGLGLDVQQIYLSQGI